MFTVSRRGLSSMSAAVVKAAGGKLKLDKLAPLSSLGATDVSLKMLMSPIHKSDLKFAEDGKQPAFLGAEGLAEVNEVGSGVKSLKKGDWVVPPLGFGCWRNSAVASESSLLRVPNDIPPSYAATLSGDLSTAYRLLRDFVPLKKGDVLIQNDATSHVGLAVVQLARELGITTVNIIDSSLPESESLLRLLTNLGGSINITDAYVNSYGLNEILAELPPCKLALDGTGGEVVTHISRCLGPQGCIVSYENGVVKSPIVVPQEFLAAPKQLSLKSFSITAWHAAKAASAPVDRAIMIAELAALIRESKLASFHELHDLDDIAYAIESAQEPNRLRKVVLNLNFPDRLAEHDAIPSEKYWVFDTTTV